MPHESIEITLFIACQKCFRNMTDSDDYSEWLIHEHKDSQPDRKMTVIRCPDCTTDHARRLCGLRQEYYHQQKEM